MLSKLSLSALFLLITTANLLAQVGSDPVSSPQQGATHTHQSAVWYTQPFVWMGSGIVLLLVILLMLRGKNWPSHNRLHRTNSPARPQDAKPAS